MKIRMKTRVILTTVIAFLLLVAVVAAGLNTVFTVTLVEAEFTLVSEKGKEDAAALQDRLDSYRGKSTTFLSLSRITEEAEAFPCFRLESVAKRFPSTIEVKVSERKETFAVFNGDTYAILDETGAYIYDGENVNRAGGENIELVGFGELSFVRGEVISGEHTEELFSAFNVLSEKLGEVRASVVSLSFTTNGVQNFLEIGMREGIRIKIEDPKSHAAEKTEAALCDEKSGYFSRTAEQRVRGEITAYELDESGTVSVNYNGGKE